MGRAQGGHFEAPAADRRPLEAEMSQFTAWFDAPVPIDPVLKAGVAHLCSSPSIPCLDRAVDAAEVTLVNVLHKADVWHRLSRHSVNERQRRVVNRMLGVFEGFLTTSKYAKLAKCSPDAALQDIRELMEWGVVVQNPGGGRSTSYRLVAADEDRG